MKPEDFQFFADFLKRQSGIAVHPRKTHIVESRLMPVARRHGFKDVGAFITELRSNNRFDSAVVEAMTTHESYFFRDKSSFDHIRQTMLPRLMKMRKTSKCIRIWCAGVSTGQEPYSLAMVLDGLVERLAGWEISILATDIDTEVMNRASAGFYSEFEILRGLPIQMLARHFSREEDGWRLSNAIRERVHFKIFNLLDSFDTLGTFDIIFCRNVLIHFDPEAKHNVLSRFHATLAPEGYLVLGSDETMPQSSHDFAPLKQARGIYVRAGAGAGADKPTVSKRH